MKVGDIIINPYVSKEYKNIGVNPLYKSMIIHIGSEYTTTLRIDGKTSKYYTKDVKEWKVENHVDIRSMILAKTEDEG